MPTVFISASDTGCGKTYVTAALACRLLLLGHSVQVVKAVETGVDATTARVKIDVGFVEAFVERHARAHCAALSVATLHSFSHPLAPADAASLEGKVFCFDTLLDAFNTLPQRADWRLVEGAGGLAVPLEDAPGKVARGELAGKASATGQPKALRGTTAAKKSAKASPVERTPRDWADFAHAIGAEASVLVVADRLGAINQARLLAAYAVARGLPQAGLWLNEVQGQTCPDVRRSNARALGGGAAAVPLWAIQNYGELWPKMICVPWLT